jgi:pseudouridine-5'-phosphate glycosidase
MNGIPLQGASSDLYDMRARVSTHTHTHTHKLVLYNPVTEQWSVDYQYMARRLEFIFGATVFTYIICTMVCPYLLPEGENLYVC